MRYFVIFLMLIIGAAGLVTLPSCDGGDSETGGSGNLIADFDLEGEEYLAAPDTPLERLCSLFHNRTANAESNLGWDSNSYPFNIFTGERNAESGLQVLISAPDMTFVAQGVTGTNGRVSFNTLPSGFLNMTITGSEGNNYTIPIQILESSTSRTRILVFRDADTNGVQINAKTIHDVDGDGLNDDNFSYAVFGRPRNQAIGGRVHLHIENETRLDANGDGDFLDPDDEFLIEPDDDGVTSDQGDGDEDNDGLLDHEDPDIDGDGILNGQDPDMDGDGLMNADDPYPDGITPNDDFNPPSIDGALFYTGVDSLAKIDEHTVSVFFPEAFDDMNPPVVYNIYYSTTTDPFNFDTATLQRFIPINKDPVDGFYFDNVTGLITDQTYYFVVRVQDNAQPPNEDINTESMDIKVGPPD